MRLRKLLTLSVVSLFLMGFTFPSSTDSKTHNLTVSFHQLDKQVKKEIECLTDNIHFEAGNEPDIGKVAVAFVTMNRVNSGNYPSRVCDVIKQKRNNVCQFSWVCEKKTTAKNVLTLNQERYYNYIRELAMVVYLKHHEMHDPTRGALFYHANYVNPKWKSVKKTTTIGKHIFYKPKKETNI